MHTLTVELPSDVETHEARLLLMVKLYERGRLSLGQAAAAAGHSKRAFMELVGTYGAAVFDHPAGDLRRELEL